MSKSQDMQLCCSPTYSLMPVLLSSPFLITGIHLTLQIHCSLYERNVNWMMSYQIPFSRRTGLHSKTLSGKGVLAQLRPDFCIKVGRELLGVSLHKFLVQNAGLCPLSCSAARSISVSDWVSGCCWHSKCYEAPHPVWSKTACHITCNISSS